MIFRHFLQHILTERQFFGQYWTIQITVVWRQLRALGTIHLERPQILRDFWPLPLRKNTQKRVSLPKNRYLFLKSAMRTPLPPKNCGCPTWMVPHIKPKLFLPEGVLISCQPRLKKTSYTTWYLWRLVRTWFSSKNWPK